MQLGVSLLPGPSMPTLMIRGMPGSYCATPVNSFSGSSSMCFAALPSLPGSFAPGVPLLAPLAFGHWPSSALGAC